MNKNMNRRMTTIEGNFNSNNAVIQILKNVILTTINLGKGKLNGVSVEHYI